jgi:glycosyltransferase involved in cell wall biosynthesis
MKIVQLATSLSGGAGIAALRMSNALNCVGEDSMIISRDGIITTGSSDVISTKINSLKRLESAAITLSQSNILQKNNDLVTPWSMNTLKISKKVFERTDIIHIHAYYNFLSSSSLRKILALGKPTLFTLHDQRLFTGGCHYSRACNNFKANCTSCPQVRKPFARIVKKSLSKQRNLFRYISNVELVSPSHWLANYAKKASISRDLPIHVVKNPIPKIFFETKVSEQKTSDGLFRVAFIATNLQNPYKDLTIFTKAINECSKLLSRKICVVLVGKGVIPNFEPTVQIEHVQPRTESEMVLLLSTIDLVIVPSNQDNSPSVIGEALAMGVPVIGSDAGGIPEILRNFQMPIFSVGDVKQLTELVIHWKPQINREIIREKARKEFSEEVVGRELSNIYLEFQMKLI